MPVKLLNERGNTLASCHITTDRHIHHLASQHQIIATSSSLQSLLAHTKIHVTVKNGVAYIGHEIAKKRAIKFAKTFLDKFTTNPQHIPITTYNSWILNDKTLLIRHKTDSLMLTSLSFKTRMLRYPFDPLKYVIPPIERMKLWLHNYIRGENTVVLGFLKDDHTLVGVRYVKQADLVCSGDEVIPSLMRLDIVLDLVRTLANGCWILQLSANECSVFKEVTPDDEDGCMQDLLDQLDFD